MGVLAGGNSVLGGGGSGVVVGGGSGVLGGGGTRFPLSGGGGSAMAAARLAKTRVEMTFNCILFFCCCCCIEHRECSNEESQKIQATFILPDSEALYDIG